MKCRDLITRKPITVTEDTTLDRVSRIMRDYDIGLLPVVDEKRRVTGVVTDRDLVTRALADRLPTYTQVAEVMSTQDLAFCGPDDDLAIVESRMERWKKSRLLVLDPFGRCVGVVSVHDIVRLGGTLMGGRVLSAISARAHA